MLKKFASFFFEPRIALLIFVFFLIAALIFLDEEGAFVGKFLQFGPSTDPKTQTTFLHMKLDTWHKVIMVYIIAFLSAFLQNYYGTVMYDFIHNYAWNPVIKKIDYSKKWTYLITTIEPILYFILGIVSFFIFFTQQLQFIFIQFFANSLINIPYTWYRLSQKTFTKP